MTPIAGEGIAQMPYALVLDSAQWKQVGPDLYVSGRVQRSVSPNADG